MDQHSMQAASPHFQVNLIPPHLQPWGLSGGCSSPVSPPGYKALPPSVHLRPKFRKCVWGELKERLVPWRKKKKKTHRGKVYLFISLLCSRTTLDFELFFSLWCGLLGADSPGLKKDIVFLLKAMVAYDELGSLVPIKRTLQVIDYQNQASKESEVRCEKHTWWLEIFLLCLPVINLCLSVNVWPELFQMKSYLCVRLCVNQRLTLFLSRLGTQCLCVFVSVCFQLPRTCEMNFVPGH